MHHKIGQLLSQIVPLSDHDVEDILQEQKSTRQRFGDAAMALGMVQPEHIWKAWIRQLEEGDAEIDLDQTGVDTQALHHVPATVVRHLRLIPVRVSDHEIVLASDRRLDDITRQQVQKQIAERAIFVLASPTQVERAIARHYPSKSRKSEAA